MPRKYLKVIPLIGLFSILTSNVATATSLLLECDDKETHSDGSVYDIRMRFDINFDVAVWRSYHIKGGKFVFHAKYDLVRADNDEIIMQDSEDQYESINRHDGTHYYKNSGSGLLQQGVCHRVSDSKRQF